MPELRSYLKPDLPRDISIQIAGYVRTQWPQFIGRQTKCDWTPYPDWCLHFVIVEGDVLISHAIAASRKIEHGGQTYNVGGLSSVFCYPSHRGSGFGEQVVTAATEHLRSDPSVDFALLFCGQRVRTLYERTGWELVPAPRIYSGDRANPALYNDGFVMGVFLTDKGRAFRPILEQEPVYVGANTW
jgi:GNAT superfamily N-acetyltransferase